MSDRATANSAFFNALPPEVRISILTAAFGGRTLHIQECKPETLQSQREAPAYVPQTSRGALGNARQRLGRLFRTKTEEKKEEPTQPAMRRMKWCGRVCHRQPDQSPAEDSCLGMLTERLQKRGCSCGSPPELVIGAIGWLLTCRRAYDEGISILYGSNTFHVRTTSMRMLGHLVPQIPATILSRITSVECVMDDLFISYQDYVALPPAEKSDAQMLSRTVCSIPRLMPSLQKLYVGFWPRTCLLNLCPYGGGILQYNCTLHLASLWEAMAFELGQMGRSCDLELALPSTPFEQYHHEAKMQGRSMGLPNWGPEMPSKFSYHPRLRLFQPARGPGAELELGTGEGGGSDPGYWMSLSLSDGLKPGSHTVNCCFMEHDE